MRVKKLTIHPLSGARGIEVESAKMYPSGLRNEQIKVRLLIDRQFVCFDPVTGKRVSSKPDEVPLLARFEPDIVEGLLYLAFYDELSPQHNPISELYVKRADDGDNFKLATTIDEFGDNTPVYDLGDEVSGFMSDLLCKEVRLGQKTPEWLNASSDDVARRKVAGLHVATLQSLMNVGGVICEDGRASAIEIDEMYAQIRAGMLIDLGDIPGVEWPKWPEAKWAPGSRLSFGHRRGELEVTGPCVRCPVPGRDALTGNKAELVMPKAYQSMPKIEYRKRDGTVQMKSTLGAYVFGAGPAFTIEVGDPVHLIDEEYAR